MSSIHAVSATQSVFELVLVRPVLTETDEHPRLAHLWWRAPMQGERVVQIYLDGALCDVVLDPDRREHWLALDRRIAHRIELMAVDPSVDDPWRAVALPASVRGVASIVLLRDESLAADTHVRVLDQDTVLDEGPMWPGDEHRSGFGALFGEGGFGFDAATGPGLGLGELGAGPLGADNTAWRWRREDLEPGDHNLRLLAVSRDGQTLAEATTLDPLTIRRLPDPPKNVGFSSDFTLTWDQP